MHREFKQWYSPSLGREMRMLIFGHGGIPILAFPSSMGSFYEWEDFKMVASLSEQLEHGHNMMFCVESVAEESFYNRSVHPHVRIKRHQQYEEYIINEVVPLIHHRSGQHFIIASGASFGAYYAANFVFKNPWHFGKLVSLSGAFDIRSFMDGFYSDDVYFNNPPDYLPNINDHNTLEAIRRNQIVLTYGDYDPCKAANEHLSHVLDAKGIPHTVDMQHGAFGHDWPWWRDLIRQYVP